MERRKQEGKARQAQNPPKLLKKNPITEHLLPGERVVGEITKDRYGRTVFFKLMANHRVMKVIIPRDKSSIVEISAEALRKSRLK